MTITHENGAAPQLQGRVIMITRAEDQARATAELLERLGAEVIHVPTIEFIEPADWTRVDSAIENLSQYDWVLFTSANGVRFFFRRLSDLAPERRGTLERVGVPNEVNVAAIGPATARALEAAGFPAMLIAKDSRAEGVLRAVVEAVGGESFLSGKRFLIPRAEVARDLLPDELRRRGALVDTVAVYRTVRPECDASEIIRSFKESRVDAIVFTSSSTVKNFAAIVGVDDLSDLLAGVVIACIGPVTAATAVRHGLKNIVQPEAFTTDALVEALVREISR